MPTVCDGPIQPLGDACLSVHAYWASRPRSGRSADLHPQPTPTDDGSSVPLQGVSVEITILDFLAEVRCSYE